MKALGYTVAVPVAGFDFYRLRTGLAMTAEGATRAAQVIRDGARTNVPNGDVGAVAAALVRLDDLDANREALTAAREQGQNEGVVEAAADALHDLEQIREHARWLSSVLIAVSGRLQEPYEDSPDLTPWSHLVLPKLTILRESIDAKIATRRATCAKCGITRHAANRFCPVIGDQSLMEHVWTVTL